MRPSLIIAFCLTSLVSTGSGLASDILKEMNAAAAHAGMAAVAETPKLVLLHLQQVVNCLTGPESEDFDAAAGNPCSEFVAAAGNSCGDVETGAIHAMSPKQQEAIWTELDSAKQALSDDNVRKAKALATRIQLKLWNYKRVTQ